MVDFGKLTRRELLQLTRSVNDKNWTKTIDLMRKAGCTIESCRRVLKSEYGLTDEEFDKCSPVTIVRL